MAIGQLDRRALTILREARVGRLATVDGEGRPSVVPFCFAIIDAADPVVVSVLDEKLKRVGDRQLARVRNIEQNPHVAFVIDRYDEDWSRLGWIQVRGDATVLAPGDEGHAGSRPDSESNRRRHGVHVAGGYCQAARRHLPGAVRARFHRYLLRLSDFFPSFR